MISRASEISDKGVAPSNNATICCLRPDHYHHHHHHHHGNPNPSRDYCGNFKVSWLFLCLRVIIWCRDKSRKINEKSEEKTKKKVFLWCGRASAVRGMQSFRPIIYLVGPIHHWRSYWAPGQQLLFTCPTTNQPAQPDTHPHETQTKTQKHNHKHTKTNTTNQPVRHTSTWNTNINQALYKICTTQAAALKHLWLYLIQNLDIC